MEQFWRESPSGFFTAGQPTKREWTSGSSNCSRTIRLYLYQTDLAFFVQWEQIPFFA